MKQNIPQAATETQVVKKEFPFNPNPPTTIWQTPEQDKKNFKP